VTAAGLNGTTVICGLERLGLRVARALIQLGEKVVIVAESPDPALLREARRAGARYVQGRADEIAHLSGASIESARCLVLTDNADLGNLHAALSAREANPRLWIVMRMFNADLAGRAGRLLPGSRVLSASSEAAPYFAADALGLATAPARHVWGRQLLILHAPPESAPAEHDVQLDGLRLAPVDPPPLRIRPRSRRFRRLRRAVQAFFDVRFGVIMGAVATLMAVSTVVYHAALQLSWLDAFYFTATASVNGFNELGLLHEPAWVKLYGVGFVFAAAVQLAALFALLVDAVAGANILEALGVPRGRMRNHVIVVGLGNTGYRTARAVLDAGVEVAAAENAERGRFISVARRQGVPVLVADGRYRDSLRALSVEHARAIVATTDDDLANLETALTARELNPQARVVARLFDQELADRAQHLLGINACYSTSGLATPAFVAAALGDGVLTTIERGSRVWLVGQVVVQAGSRLRGARTASLEEPGELRLLAVRAEGVACWRPGWPERLEAGHAVLVVCGRERWQRLRAQAGHPVG
jgi:Trk K+ transport system NAD-binding subunit